MNPTDILGLMTTGDVVGILGVMLTVLAMGAGGVWTLLKSVRSDFDKIHSRINEHGHRESERHQEVTERVARIETKLDQHIASQPKQEV